MTATAERKSDEQRPLSSAERGLLARLGLPTFALALAVTTVTTYVPVVARETIGSTTVIGLLVGIEGLMALWVPLVVGPWSDRLRTRWGGRLPFLIAAAPVATAALAILALVRAPGAIAGAVSVFFLAYFVAYEPYRALYADGLPEEAAGRGQSTQAVFRGLGTFCALVGGGLLLAVGRPVPFITAAVILGLTLAAFAVLAIRRGIHEKQDEVDDRSPRKEAGHLWHLLRRHAALRAFLIANGLWELSLGALKTFVILYLTQGLGLSTSESALAVGVAAVFILVAAALSGKVGDSRGRLRLLRRALPLYGLGLLVPLFFTAPLVVALVVPFVAAGGGVIMSLPYAILVPLMPEEDHGALTGFYTFSRGVGIALGPLLGGVAVSALSSTLSATQGYQAVWGVCGVAILASLPFVRRLAAAVRD